MNLGKNLRHIREQKKISRELLAANSGTTGNTIYRIETGQQKTSIDTLIKIAKTLDVPVAYLIGEIDTPELPKQNNELPDFIQERLSKLDSIESKDLKTQLKEIAKKLNDIADEL